MDQKLPLTSKASSGQQSVLPPSPTEGAKPAAHGQLARGRATGPRTELGKERSSRNATTHGIFSRLSVLKGEPRAEYDSLLKGLWETIQPEGMLEEVLVEKLGTILWRHRRLLMAEAAEIRNSMEFLEWDQQNQQRQEAEEIGSLSRREYNRGLMPRIQNPNVLECCLKLLTALRFEIEANGFDPDWDTPVLGKIYGRHNENYLGKNLYKVYLTLCDIAKVAAEAKPKGFLTPEQCRQNVLHEIDAEICRLKRYQKARASIEEDRTKLEILRRSVPDSPELDRLLRYEAHLERAFDRTLNQLERLQRMRLGQPVPPPIKVQLSD